MAQMDPKYEPLFTPWKIGNVEIKNRIVLCPMGGTSLFGWMEPNHFDKEAAKFFLERAKNNVGLIIPGIAPIRDTIGGRWLYKNKKMFRDLKPFMDEIHETGAKLFVQITAGMGRSWAITDHVVMLGSQREGRGLGLASSWLVSMTGLMMLRSTLFLCKGAMWSVMAQLRPMPAVS